MNIPLNLNSQKQRKFNKTIRIRNQKKNQPSKNMSQTLVITKPEHESEQISFYSAALTNFSTVCIELICVEINRQLTLQLDHSNCLQDITKFLIDQKIIHKSTEINYLLPKNPVPLNSLWTLRQIMETHDLQYDDQLCFTVQIKEEDQTNASRLRKGKEACCKCEIY